MAMAEVSFETGHDDVIHDAQLDYFGRRLATASSDRTVKVFDIVSGAHYPLAHLQGHDGPVWQVAWSHPQFNSLLATCSYDRRVFVWQQQDAHNWAIIYSSDAAQSSVNSVCWAPPEHGLALLACSADNTVAVYTCAGGGAGPWTESRFPAHVGGVNAGSWAPAAPSGTLTNQARRDAAEEPAAGPRFVTGGNDTHVRLWQANEVGGPWNEVPDAFTDGHTDWVNDVAWAPSLGLPTSTVASCSEDQTVIIWTEQETGRWTVHQRLQFDCKVWRVSWSVMGNILAVSQGDNKVSLWKEGLNGEWETLGSADEAQHFNDS